MASAVEKKIRGSKKRLRHIAGKRAQASDLGKLSGTLRGQMLKELDSRRERLASTLGDFAGELEKSRENIKSPIALQAFLTGVHVLRSASDRLEKGSIEGAADAVSERIRRRPILSSVALAGVGLLAGRMFIVGTRAHS